MCAGFAGGAVPDLPSSGPPGWGREVRNSGASAPLGALAGRPTNRPGTGLHSGVTAGDGLGWPVCGGCDGPVMVCSWRGMMVAVTGTGGLQAAEGTHGRAGAGGGARADAGGVRLTGRDIAGLVWCGEMYGIRADLLGSLLDASPDVVRQLHARWRRAGLAETGRLGPGPVWCWLTRLGLEACGLPYAANQPPLGRLRHVHAAGAVRLALEAWDAY